MFYTEDNAVAVVRKAIRHHRVKVSSEKIVERLMSHPNYPSLKSICDSLEEWNIQYYAARLDLSELKETGVPFIAHLYEDGEKLAFIPKFERTGFVKIFETYSKSRTLTDEEFLKRYSGISVLIDPKENSGESEFATLKQNETVNRILPFLALLVIAVSVVYMFLNTPASLYPGLIIKFVGVILSVLLFMKSLNIASSISDLVCGLGKKVNCNTILNSNASQAFGWVHWTEVGLIYFVSTFLIQVFTASIESRGLISLLAFLATGFTVYSIYYQWRVAKVWCGLCLAVQAILIADAIYYAIIFERLEFSVAGLLIIVFIFLLAGLSVLLYKGWFTLKQASINNRIRFLKLKRNPAIFKHLLHSGEKIQPHRNPESFVIGNPAASAEIDAFLNLKCQPCRDVFDQLADLSNSSDVRINLWFVMAPEDAVVIGHMSKSIKGTDHAGFIQFVKSWYRDGSVDKKDRGDEKLFSTYEKSHFEQFRHFKVETTPTIFLDGYKLPSEYQVRDLNYLIAVVNE